MIELGLAIPLDMVKGGPLNDEVGHDDRVQPEPNPDQPISSSIADIGRHFECDRIAKQNKHQLVDVVNGHCQTLSLRSFDALCHDKPSDEEE